jgi:hypothetical protein
LVRHDCENDADQDADQRDEISYAEGHFGPPFQRTDGIETAGESRNVLV